MSLFTRFLGSYYRWRYAFSAANDREKYLLRSTNLFLRTKGRTLASQPGPRFISSDELASTALNTARPDPAPQKTWRPSLDIFRDNTALFLTAPENMPPKL